MFSGLSSSTAINVGIISADALSITPSSGLSSSTAINVGIITERFGEHLGGFLAGFGDASAGVQEVAAADITGGAQFHVVVAGLPAGRLGPLFTSVDSMLSQHHPQLTLVTAEAHNSAALVEAALRSGSHVLLEKPGCQTLAEFEALCDLAGQRGLELMLAMAT